MKKLFSAVVVIFALSAVVPPAIAGGRDRYRHHKSPQQYRWEGVAIGVGAAIFGNALIHASRHQPGRAYSHRGHRQHGHSKHYRYPSHRHYRSGYWKVYDVWVPPEYGRVWRPEHRRAHGHFSPGAWVTVEIRPGYWKKERVWSSRR